MFLTERERGLGSNFGATLLDYVIRTLSVNHRTINGPARVVFPDGRSHPVKASVELYHSALSSWGGGNFQSESEVGFDALECRDWLTLTFEAGARFEVEIYDVKASDRQCRSRFEVKS